MKKKFREQFALEQEKKQSIWKNAIVVFDTNILLNLYRYNKETCDDLLKYMKTFSDRLWMPFQVGWEYHNNRLNVAYNYQNAYCELLKVIEENRKSIEGFFQKFPHHPQLSSKVFFELYDRSEIEIRKYIDGLKENDSKNFDKDTILETLADLYDGKVGEDYSEDRYKEIYKEGDKRYKSKIPPGYKDDTKDKREKGERHLYGDYLVWQQIIDKAVAVKKDFIFVSDDLKEDWLLVIHGEKKGPRKELLKEFNDKTHGNTILIYNQEQFLNYARNIEKADIKDETINEVKSVHQDMLNFYAEYVQHPVLRDLGLNSLSAGTKQLISKPIFNNNLFSTLNNCKTLGDSLRIQAENMQSMLKPFSSITESIYTTDNIASINEALYPKNVISSHAWGVNPNDPYNLTGFSSSILGKYGVDDDK